MSVIKKISFYLVILLSTLVILATLLSLLYDVNIWWLKVLDFPRPQLLSAGLVLLLVFGIINSQWSLWPRLLLIGMVAAVSLQAYYILPYSPVVAKKVSSGDTTAEVTISLLIANVYMHNRQAENFLNVVSTARPDLVLVMENDQWWNEALQSLRADYDYYQEFPANNTYGMSLYSRYPLKNMQINFFQHDSVPSFHTDVQLPKGHVFHFHGVHPVPPIISKQPDNEWEQELALIKVGKMVAQRSHPTIVAGDFNDVAWSNTSRLFEVDGRLNDVRVGRGLYNSFDATSLLLRWPLDHIYVSDEFRVVSLERLDNFGSDHFPIYVELELTEN